MSNSIAATVPVEIRVNRRQSIGILSPEHFWRRVQKPVGCWLYGGGKEINGYGYLKNPFGDKPKYLTAHRVAWMLTHGPIPDGMKVLHRCDIRACVNPEHLFLGNDAANSADMLSKDRHSGALTAAQVREIRALIGTMPQVAIAKSYGVCPQVVSLIKLGKTYRFVT